ncbi:hypothetical protein H0H92_003830 [Tricholoma furcatifolium]|nr:hypothetical protein H0H92_003830 [Tricholoma furcatifolium]
MSGKQKALFLESKFGEYKLGEQDIHEPGAGELLVKVEVVALNPADWKIQARGFDLPYPIVGGAEIAGIVEKLGKGVSGFAVGDRVAFTSVWTRTRGGFQEYALADAETTAKIPQRISLEEAVTIPGTIASGLCGLYLPRPHGVGLIPPLDVSAHGKYAGRPLVVLGASSNVGQNVIQLANLSGFNPIVATASLKNAEHLKSIGATHVIDRNTSPDAQTAEIRKIIPGPIDVVYDAVSFPETQQLGYSLISDGGFLVVVLRPVQGIETTEALGHTSIPARWASSFTESLQRC